MLASMAPNYEMTSPADLQSNSASLYMFEYDEDYFEEDIECDYLVIAAKTFADMISADTDLPGDEELEKLLRWRSTDNNSPNGFDIMVANVDEIVKWYEEDDNAVRSTFNNYEVAIMIDDFIEEVYDEATAPHTFGDKLSYLLIVGDSHSKNFDSGAKWKPYDVSDDFDVPVTIYDSTSDDATVSDLPYACIDSRGLYVPTSPTTYGYNEYDEYPELKMGRITADNALEEDSDENDNRDAEAVMNDIAEKIYEYEQNTTYSDSWRRRRYYFSGFYEGKGSISFRRQFRNWHLRNHDLYEDQQGYTFDNIEIRDYDLDDYSGSFSNLVDGCSDDLIAGLTETSSEQLFFFSCHGSYNGMLSYEYNGADQQYIMDNDTVDDLDFGDDYPVVFGYISCSTANFCESFYEDKGEDSPSPTKPDDRCFGETWLRTPDNGAIAYYDFTTSIKGDSNGIYSMYLGDSYEMGTLWVIKTIELPLSRGRYYILLGDPAADIGDARVAPTRPNLSVSWGGVEFNDQDSDYDDGDWSWLDADDQELNVSVDVVNTGGASSPSTILVFTYYKVESNGNKTALPNTESVNIPSLDPGESATVHVTCDQFTGIDSDHSSDWDYDFVVKAQVTTVIGETNTDDNSVWYPDDDVESYDETHDGEAFADSFDPSGITFYNFVEGWSSVPSPSPLASGLGAYNSPVVLADLDGDDEDEIIVQTASGYLSVFAGDGSTLNGWPKYVGISSKAPSIGNLDADPALEIVCAGDGKVQAYNHSGTTVSGWSTPIEISPTTDIVVANLDASGTSEIIFGSIDYLYAYHGNKSPYTSWLSGRVDTGTYINNISVTNLDSASSTLEVLYVEEPEYFGGTYSYGCYDASGDLLFSKSGLSEGLRSTYSLDIGDDNDQETFFKTGVNGHQLRAWEDNGDLFDSFTATTDQNQTINYHIVHGTIGSGDDAVEVIAVITADGLINAWNLYGFDVATAVNDSVSWPPLIADVDGSDGPDFVGVYSDGMVRAFKRTPTGAEAIDEYTFTIHDSSIQMGAIGNIDDDDESEFVFTAGDKVIALELEGLASDIQWGQYRHDASHDNAD
jgi:hypothetical protein